MMSQDPSVFVDNLGSGKHVVLFYDDPNYGRLLEFRFIKNGLLKGEGCTYLTYEEAGLVEKQMTDNGIDVEKFKQKNLLRIYQVPKMNEPAGVTKIVEKIWDEILQAHKSPFRVAGQPMPAAVTEEYLEAQLAIERAVVARFNGQGSVLCSYSVENIEPVKHGKWLSSLLKMHHDAVFAIKSRGGIGFNMR